MVFALAIQAYQVATSRASGSAAAIHAIEVERRAGYAGPSDLLGTSSDLDPPHSRRRQVLVIYLFNTQNLALIPDAPRALADGMQEVDHRPFDDATRWVVMFHREGRRDGVDLAG